jgi:hypothetical protein
MSFIYSSRHNKVRVMSLGIEEIKTKLCLVMDVNSRKVNAIQDNIKNVSSYYTVLHLKRKFVWNTSLLLH